MDSPELSWHREGKARVLAALAACGIDAREDVSGVTPGGTKWKADVLFTVNGRSVTVQLQRGYQPLREFRRRQQRFAESGIECFWLFRREPFQTLTANIAHTRRGRALPELPVALLDEHVEFGDTKSASVSAWLTGVLDGTFCYRDGGWSLQLERISQPLPSSKRRSASSGIVGSP